MDNKWPTPEVRSQLMMNSLIGVVIMAGGMMNENDWMGGHSWRWFPTIVTLLIGALIG